MEKEKANERIDLVVAKQLKILKYLELHPLFDGEDSTSCEIMPDMLSRIAISLATNNAFLGQIVAHYQYELDMSEVVRKNARVDAYKKFRTTIKEDGKAISQGDAEVFADGEVSEMLKEEMETKRMLLKVKNLRADCGDMVTAIQSRIGFSRDELKNSLMPNPT